MDKAMVVRFVAPHSFSGEDMVELHCHGGAAVLRSLLAALAALDNMRVAEAGEFTRRAVLAGRLDLTQAEAIADLVAAEGSAQQAQALEQMSGRLRHLFEGWRHDLVQILAHLEAAIEFDAYDLEEKNDLAESNIADINNNALSLLPPLRESLAHYVADRRGVHLRDGLRIVLRGATNVGKSSILNALSGKEAAIVTPERGTTRDIIEVNMILAGVPVVLVDTAGLRETQDHIEREGVRRATIQAEEADILLDIVSPDTRGDKRGDTKTDYLHKKDPKNHKNTPKNTKITQNDPQEENQKSTPNTDEANNHNNILKLGNMTQNTAKNRQITIKIHNKTDLSAKDDDCDLEISAKTGAGLDELVKMLENTIKTHFNRQDSAVLTRERHHFALNEAIVAIDRGLAAAQNGAGAELVAEDIRLATRALGRVTGAVDVESLLDVVFSDFCIGK